MQLAPFIDHTILKQTTTRTEVQGICAEAAQYGFAAACVPPFYVSDAMGFLKSSGVKVCTVIGFPFGYHEMYVKLEEAKKAVADGADELDMVINVAALKSGDLHIVKEEVAVVSTFSKAHAKTLKVIIESGTLSDAEIIACCDICKALPVQFVKTSTGFAEVGATVHAVQLMRQHLPSTIQVKASGGIRTSAFAKVLVQAGASRLGCSASVAIIKEEPAGTTY